MSRDQQWNLTALRRYDDAEAEYQRGKTLAGSHAQPEYIRFLRLLSREDTDPQALRDQYRLMQDSEDGISPALPPGTCARPWRSPGHAEGSEEGVRGPAVRGDCAAADALGDADLALASLRSTRKGRSHHYVDYWQLWIAPYSALRTLPGFKR